jgi:hypothetical protein
VSCEYITDKDGKFLGVVCGLRRSKPAACTFCGRPSTKLCDFLVGGKTCDSAICDRCSVSVGEDRDYCLGHSRVGKRFRVLEGKHAGHVMQLLAWRKVQKRTGVRAQAWKYASQCSCLAAGDIEPAHLRLLDLTVAL